MLYAAVSACRICANPRLTTILDLGEQALSGVFPRSAADRVEAGPIELVKCDEAAGGCGLVQLRHSFPPEKMYGANYGYRSGLNQSMVRHLHRRVGRAAALAAPRGGDVILDIGSNDGTTLKAYPDAGYRLVGVDPAGRKFAAFYPSHIRLIPDYFSAAAFEKAFPGRKAKIVTSIAMFYDLERPQEFMAQVHRVLADDGVWAFEQSYCPAMLAANAYDTVCHEHLSYYALRQVKWMTDRTGFKIIDVERNDVNGGSFCVTVAKEKAPYPAAAARVEEQLGEEDGLGLSTLRPFEAFRRRVFQHRDALKRFVADLRRQGKTVYGYGASTKGNVVLQFGGFTANDIPAVAEVNEDKFGAFTPGTMIPIRSEAEVRACEPDYLLVLPWHFRNEIVRREADYLARGGKLLMPLPAIEVVEAPAALRAA